MVSGDDLGTRYGDLMVSDGSLVDSDDNIVSSEDDPVFSGEQLKPEEQDNRETDAQAITRARAVPRSDLHLDVISFLSLPRELRDIIYTKAVPYGYLDISIASCFNPWPIHSQTPTVP